MIVELLLQATIVFLAGFAIAKALRGRAARAHTVVVAAFVAVATLPLVWGLHGSIGWGVIPKTTALVELDPAAQRPSSERTAPEIQRDVAVGDPITLAERDGPLSDSQLERAPSNDTNALPGVPSSRTDRNSRPGAVHAQPSFMQKQPDQLNQREAANSIRSTDAGSVFVIGLSSWSHGARQRFTRILLTAWAALSGLAVARLAVGIMQAIALKRSATDCSSMHLQSCLRSAMENMGITADVDLLVSRSTSCPVIWCWQKPAIILPARSLDRTLDWEGLMTHELAHLKRRDHWTGLLCESMLCVLPWHPIAAGAKRLGYRLSEQACDDWAARLSLDREYLAESILAFAPVRRLPLLAPMSSSMPDLRRRIERIFDPRRPDVDGSHRRWRLMIWSLAAAVIVAVGLVRQANSESEIATEKEMTEANSKSTMPEAPSQDDKSSWTNAEWILHLKAVPEDSRWFVGARLGGELSNLPGRRAIEILTGCWSDIPASVRQQMLKGFQPSFRSARGWNEAYFEVMHLGMTSHEAGVRRFATVYLHDLVFRDFGFGGEDYLAWREETESLTASEVISLESTRLAYRLLDAEQTEPEELVHVLGDEYRGYCLTHPALRRALIDIGVKDRIVQLLDAGVLVPGDYRVDHLIEVFDLPHQLDASQIIGELLAAWKEDPNEVVRRDALWQQMSQVGDIGDESVIPSLIALICADNSETTIYGVGYFALGELTGIRYSPFHDGAWWRRWWDANKHHYSAEVQMIPIETLPLTNHGKHHVAYPESMDSLEGKVSYFRRLVANGEEMYDLISEIADEHGQSAESIPIFIGLIDADNSQRTIRALSMEEITGVPFNRFRDGAWWRQWWSQNQQRFPMSVRNTPIPDLPKTDHGRHHQPFPPEFLTFDGLYNWLRENDPAQHPELYRDVIEGIEDAYSRGSTNGEWDPIWIPKIISIIESDNSYDTVYGLGYFTLGRTLDVDYNPMNDGAWWRRWWDANRSQFPLHAQRFAFTPLPKTEHGKNYTSLPSSLESYDGLVDWILEGCPSTASLDSEDVGKRMASVSGDIAVPFFIEWFASTDKLEDSEARQRLRRGIRRFLRDQMETRIPEEVDTQWFRAWWQEYRQFHSREAQLLHVPDLSEASVRWIETATERQQAIQDEEFEGIPATRIRIGDEEQAEYFQIGPREGVEVPESGWKVLVILPGGDGSADFQSFCRRIHLNALPDDYVALQLIAPVWSDVDDRVVWPMEKLNPDEAAFTTEEFIGHAVADAGERLPVDKDFVFALGWSSGGPPVYASSVDPSSPITGSFVAMSVFRPEWMTDVSRAEDHPYYILHSPEDWIDFEEHAEGASTTLSDQGATVRLKTYRGGHGWRDDPYGNIRAGIEWLQAQIRTAPLLP